MSDLFEITEKLEHTEIAIRKLKNAIAEQAPTLSVMATLQSLEKRRDDLEAQCRAEGERVSKAFKDFSQACEGFYSARGDGPALQPICVSVDRELKEYRGYGVWGTPAPIETESVAPRKSIVDIRPQEDGTTVLHIDKTQVRLRFGAESEEKVEIVLEPRQQT